MKTRNLAKFFYTSTILLLGLSSGQIAQAVTDNQTAPPLQPVIVESIHNDLSPALSSLPASIQAQGEPEGVPIPALPLPKAENAFPANGLELDPQLQSIPASGNMPATDFNFDGVTNTSGVIPPDPNGDIGPNHYVQWVNLKMAIWQIDRVHHTATLVYGPTAGNAIWAGFGGPCQDSNQGDPIVLYDHLADRWFISQFALPSFPLGPFYQCIAVSQTGNPTGAWYRYFYLISDTKMNDYPHFGVWPDGYYMTVNQFFNGVAFAGAGAAVFERDKMLLGLPARMVFFDLFSANPAFGGMLPSDLDGPPPPAGTPNVFAEVDDSTEISPQDAMRLWEFHVNWTDPASSTFGINGQPSLILPVANFIRLLTHIPQPGTTIRLDNLADRLMHRLQYRNFGAYATLVVNHTVDAGDGRAAVRWYELRNPGSGWSTNQQGTYAGDGSNTLQRWMGSAAMDRAGDIAIGYSRSSGSVYPGIAYTGRLAGDPANTLPQGEAILWQGGGSQTHTLERWGDYSMLGIDPVDDCTFWYTNEYYTTTSSSSWRTRIGSFAFPSCSAGLTGSLQGMVTSSGSPLPGITVQANTYSTQTSMDGSYSFPGLPVGTYTMTVQAYGYQPVSLPGIRVVNHTTTVQDFALNALPLLNVNGTVSDGSGEGWPLYARLDISAPGFSRVIFTDPLTGAYSLELPAGIPHSFQVSVVLGGYLSDVALVTPTLPGTVQDFAMLVDDGACNALGYSLNGGCNPLSGGLVVGHTFDANTGAALDGASIASVDQPDDLGTSFPTPDDPAQEDGLYILFSSLTGGHSFTASKISYGDDTRVVAVANSSTVGQDFSLPAGRLIASPTFIVENLGFIETVTATLTLSNTGAHPAQFTITEVDAPFQAPVPTGPFARTTRHVGLKHLADLDAQSVFTYNPPIVPSLPGGQVLESWTSGLAHPWGIGYDTRRGELWIGDMAAGGGDDHLHGFLPDGTRTGAEIDTSSVGAIYSAGLVYNPFSRKFWQTPVGGGSCLFEIDPVAQALSGAEICPPFDYSQRGLAFNPLDRTYYAGAWTSGILYHFDGDGTILDSANLDLNISGLAFNPSTHHLFVLTNAATGLDVYVLDVADAYRMLGGFNIPGLGDYEQAGLSMDCAAHLWVVNQVTGQVFEVDSGEGSACAYADIPWLTLAPAQGTVNGGTAQAVVLTFDTSAASALRNHASLVIGSDTPYEDLTISVDLNVGLFHFFPLILR